MRNVRNVSLALVVPLTLLLLWQGVTSDESRLPGPLAVGPALVSLVTDGELGRHLLASLRRVGLGYAIATMIALSVAIVAGLARPRIANWIEDVVGLFRPLPPFAWIPLSIIWFGISDQAASFIIVVAAFFPIFTNTLHGLREVPADCVQAAQTLGARRSDIVRHVLVPSAVPAILTGMRLSAGLSIAVIIGAELVIGYTLRSGVGYLFVNYVLVRFNPGNVLALMLTVGVSGLLLDTVLRRAQNHWTRWRPSTAIESR